MKTVTINTKNSYKVLIDKYLLEKTGDLVSEYISPCKAAIICDDNVSELYLKIVKSSLKNKGYECISFIFKAGESSKNISVYTEILEFLASNSITRTDIIIALGGGVCGDMAGFCAATYLRGIKFVGIPTTLLAAVDSSVGGKTAVNLSAGKNLVGAFHQPSLVICDTNTLNTLPENYLKDGISETIKYGIITDRGLFDIMKGNYKNNLEEIIERCVSIKNTIVSADVYDKKERQLLNLGHTFGHAIEKLSNFKISHGHAVAIGMVIASRAAEKIGLAVKGTTEEIITVLNNCSLPTSTEYNAEDITNISLNDKKRTGNTITLVLPEKIGHSVLYKINTKELYDIVKKGLE